jgi:hypothetical protein
MEDMPDMAFKFASYETLRRMHRQVFDRTASAQVTPFRLILSNTGLFLVFYFQ